MINSELMENLLPPLYVCKLIAHKNVTKELVVEEIELKKLEFTLESCKNQIPLVRNDHPAVPCLSVCPDVVLLWKPENQQRRYSTLF